MKTVIFGNWCSKDKYLPIESTYRHKHKEACLYCRWPVVERDDPRDYVGNGVHAEGQRR